MGAEFCEITPRKVVAVWGAGPVGQFAIASARMLGAEKINFEDTPVQEALRDLTAGRGPDACIDAVGLEATGHGLQFAHDKIDPSFVVSHHMNLDDAAKGYDMFMHKQDDVMKIVMRS